MNFFFAGRVSGMESSAIREILKITEKPGVISFAGGLPAPELFPVADFRNAISDVLGNDDGASLQYSTTEGYSPLRTHIAGLMKEKGINASPDEILVTNGSQQALDLLSKIFIDPGDTVVVENPSYLGALQVFRSYQARFCAVPTDEGGIVVESLERVLKDKKPKLIYLTPTFSNPTGVTMVQERREAVVRMLEKYEVPLIEDDPYGELRYGGQPVPPIKSFDKSGWVIYLSTFSKTIAPGIRIGWLNSGPDLMEKLVTAKQGTDLHTGTLIQRAVHRYLTTCNVEEHIEAIRAEYGRRKDAMITAMRDMFPAGIKWTEPAGGMFLWVTLPHRLNSTKLLEEAVKEKVAYVPGDPFFAYEGEHNFLRLNYSNSSPDQIQTGIERLAGLFARHL